MTEANTPSASTQKYKTRKKIYGTVFINSLKEIKHEITNAFISFKYQPISYDVNYKNNMSKYQEMD